MKSVMYSLHFLILWCFSFPGKPKIFDLWQINQVIYFYCYREMKFLNAPFVGLQDQSASHMPTSNRFSVQNQRPMAKLKFFVKEVYMSGMLALEIMAKKSAVELCRRSLCNSQEKSNFFSVIGEKVDAQLLCLVTWKLQDQENLSKL